MKTCRACGAEIAKSAKHCPHCGAKNKRPIYCRPWVYMLLAVVALVVYFNLSVIGRNFEVTVYKDSGAETIKMSELSDIVYKDSITFKEEYQGKEVSFSAKIKQTNYNMHHVNMGRYFKTEFGFPRGMVCFSDKELKYAVGDEVTVKGTIDTSLYEKVYVEIQTITKN